MSEHIEIERISALLDEPWCDLDAETHLEACEDCRAEFERLSRMRMAFSGLGVLDPPADEWRRIDASLDDILGPSESGVVPIASRRGWTNRLMVSGPIQAAAALALFAGGIFAGLQFTGEAGQPAATAGVPSVIPASGDDRQLYEALADLEDMQSPLRQVGDDANASPDLDVLEAAQMAARLDGIISALQEQLNRSPDDPFASGYLFRALEQRARLAEVIERSARRSNVVEW